MLLCRDETTHTFMRPFNTATKANTVHKMLQRATVSLIFNLSAMLDCVTRDNTYNTKQNYVLHLKRTSALNQLTHYRLIVYNHSLL